MKSELVWVDEERKEFAKAALPAVISAANDGGREGLGMASETVARIAWTIADAMVAEGQRRERNARNAA